MKTPLDIAADLISRSKSVAVLTGAGVSVSAGIPDFRSAGGLYDTLRPELLSATSNQRTAMEQDPTYVVSWDLFKDNQFPYLELRRPFILGVGGKKWHPTLAHSFFEVLHLKGKLRRLYTQNIDGLDYLTGIHKDMILPCHGSLAQASCEFCGRTADWDTFVQEVRDKIRDIYNQDANAPRESQHILCSGCRKPAVKPNTVLYGRNLPPDFFTAIQKDFPQEVDLLLIAGTSLTVSPANQIPLLLAPTACRVLVNNEDVTNYRSRPWSDVTLVSDADSTFRLLARKLEWGDELDSVFRANQA